MRGLLRSKNTIKYISRIPCDIIYTLETKEEEARNFVVEIEKGQVPTLIKNLPEDILGSFTDAVGIFLTLPSEIVDAAEAAVTDAVNVFDDIESGAIISDLADIPNVVVSDVTSAWGDLTEGFQDGWDAATDAIACFLGKCHVSSSVPGSCQSNTAAITTSDSSSVIETGWPGTQSSVVPSSTPTIAPLPTATPVQTPASVPSPTNNLTSIAVTPSAARSPSLASFQGGSGPKVLPGLFGLEGIMKACVLAALGLLGFLVCL